MTMQETQAKLCKSSWPWRRSMHLATVVKSRPRRETWLRQAAKHRQQAEEILRQAKAG